MDIENKEIYDEFIWLLNSLEIFEKAYSIAKKYQQKEKIVEYKEEIKKINLKIENLKKPRNEHYC